MPSKISPRRASLNLSPFDKDQVTWIILKFGEQRKVTKVKRAFAVKYFPKNPRSVSTYLAFKRLIERFIGSGGHTISSLPLACLPLQQRK